MPRGLRKIVLAMLVLLLFAPGANAAEIKEPSVSINDSGTVVASTSLRLKKKEIKGLSKGITREITFYLDLYRVWKSWPDEFVTGRKITRKLTCDTVKKEFMAEESSGSNSTKKRFADCESLIEWALAVRDVNVSPTGGLEPAEYFVKASAEGRIRRFPTGLGYLFFFVRERSFKAEANSAPFALGAVAGEGE